MTEKKTILVHDTHIGLWEPHCSREPDQMLGLLHDIRDLMTSRGWSMKLDPKTKKNYPTIAKSHWVGDKGDLRLFADASGRTIKVEFFQEINVVNSNGGRYDFQKFKKMPRRLRIPCVVAMAAVVRLALQKGFEPSMTKGPLRSVDPDNLLMSLLTLAEDKPIQDDLDNFNSSWNFGNDWGQGGRFKRDANGLPSAEEYDRNGRNCDRDGLPLRNGQTKYFRHRKGHLLRGKIFTNMNEMWTVNTGCGRSYVHRTKLFDCPDPTKEPFRVKGCQKERLIKELKKATAKGNWGRVAILGQVLSRAA